MSLRVAVVGTGPAGCYALQHLLGHGPGVVGAVTVIDRLPTPGGLVRFGVAPDHPQTKRVQAGFGRLLRDPRVRCRLDTEVPHAELAATHHAVLYAVGASGARTLDIPGAELSVPATEFVAWYNGHPDFAGRTFDLSGERAVVVGTGNVALDVARVLTLPADALRRTDIADHALEALAESSVREVVLLGRRGPETAAFTSPELLALTQLEDVDVAVHDPAGLEGLDEPERYGDRLKLRMLRGLKSRGRERRIVFRFHTSPEAVTGSGVWIKGTVPLIQTSLVLRSIGYRGAPVAGLPFDSDSGTIPHQRGRVEPGVYVAGWIKRGPTGVIGTNKHDAAETVAALLEDAGAGRLPEPARESTASGLDIDAWGRIDSAERAAGATSGRPRVKLTAWSELRKAGAA